ncbi:MAG: hypothetical protein FWE59_04550, partial [Oscillospiraceae bacterium]|nr:hypothetical protein [Oscillospiraceae bacterium]
MGHAGARRRGYGGPSERVRDAAPYDGRGDVRRWRAGARGGASGMPRPTMDGGTCGGGGRGRAAARQG